MEEILMVTICLGTALTTIVFKFPKKYKNIHTYVSVFLLAIICLILGYNLGYSGAKQDIWDAYNGVANTSTDSEVGLGVTFSLKAMSRSVPNWIFAILILAFFYVTYLPKVREFFVNK